MVSTRFIIFSLPFLLRKRGKEQEKFLFYSTTFLRLTM